MRFKFALALRCASSVFLLVPPRNQFKMVLKNAPKDFQNTSVKKYTHSSNLFTKCAHRPGTKGKSSEKVRPEESVCP